MPTHSIHPADPSILAHDARNALAGALGRLQLLRRRVERGEADPTRVRAALVDAEERLRLAVTLVDALEEAAEVAPLARVRQGRRLGSDDADPRARRRRPDRMRESKRAAFTG